MSLHTSSPLVSVLMANYNCAQYLEQAVQSVLAQTHSNIELIFVDDGSTDNSLDLVRTLAERDSRVRLYSGVRFGGPAPVRNFALDKAKGDWIAVVDSDDHIHPDRFSRMLATAQQTGADIIIDDLLIFNDQGDASPNTLYSGHLAQEITEISLVDYVRSNCLYDKGSGLGYAKPLFKRAPLESQRIRYNETMRIGEDYDLVYRLMRLGCSLYAMPDPLYFYRKHGRSISHRLDRESLNALLAQAQVALDEPDLSLNLLSSLNERRASIKKAIGYDNMVIALKAKDPTQFIEACLRTPSALPLLRMPLVDRLKSRRAKPRGITVDIAVIARQRVVGKTNGSSAYLLALCQYLSQQGLRVGIYWPSPETFGRWPVLALKSDMDFLTDVQWRGGVKLGRFVFATSPKTYWSFLLTALEAVLLRLKLIKASFVSRALSALKAPYRREDYLFLAPHLQKARAVIADYAFCTPYLDYRISGARTLVLMHDLFSSRPGQFVGTVVKDDYGQLTFDDEIAHLSKADAVIAIQKEEAAQIAPFLAKTSLIVAPMAADTIEAARPGDDDTILFVGSNAAPNVIGLQWFFKEVWPKVMAQRPQTILKVAGNVGRAVVDVPENVQILGLVDDLSSLYAEAGIVISPLTTGSGLKIKIVEALAQGKACVVTSITLQGIADLAENAVKIADEPDDFANALTNLLNSANVRTDLARKAVACARTHFSAEQSFRGVADFIVTR